jgi:hypothetical protein
MFTASFGHFIKKAPVIKTALDFYLEKNLTIPMHQDKPSKSIMQ